MTSRSVLVALLLLGASACGGGGASSPTAPTPVTTTPVTTTPPPLTAWTVRGYVAGLLKGGWVNGAVVRVGSSASATTDINGVFELVVDQSGELSLVVEANGFHKAESKVSIQSSKATTWVQRNIIPDDDEFDLNFFDHVFRKDSSGSLRGTYRWSGPPTVEIWTQKMKCLEPYASSDSVCGKYEVTEDSAPSSFEENIRSVVTNDVPMLTGEVVPGSGWTLSVTTKTHSPGTTFTHPMPIGAGARIIAIYMDPGASGINDRSHASFSYPAGGGVMRSGNFFIKPDATMRTYRHEMAHVLGWNHPALTGADSQYDIIPGASIMDGTTSRPNITRADKIHGYILYERDPGFTSPDTDPVGSVVNLTNDVPWDPAIGRNPYRENMDDSFFSFGSIVRVDVP